MQDSTPNFTHAGYLQSHLMWRGCVRSRCLMLSPLSVVFVLLVLLLKRPWNIFDVLIYFNICAVEALHQGFIYIHYVVTLKA